MVNNILVNFKIPEDELAVIDQACKLVDRSRSSFLRILAQEKAVQILQEKKCSSRS